MFIQNWEREEALRRLRRTEAARLERQRRLEDAPSLPPSVPVEPGVYREAAAPPGEQWYKIVMPSGRIGLVHFPDELCDQNLLPNLWRRFWAKTRRKLKVI